MKSHATAVDTICTVCTAIAAIRYGSETEPSVSQSPPIHPPTSTPNTSSATNTSTAATIQPTTLAIRRSRERSPIGLTALAADATALIGVLVSRVERTPGQTLPGARYHRSVGRLWTRGAHVVAGHALEQPAAADRDRELRDPDNQGVRSDQREQHDRAVARLHDHDEAEDDRDEPGEAEQDLVGRVGEQRGCPEDREDPHRDRVGPDHVQQGQRGHVREEEHDQADGDAGQARDHEPAAPLLDRAPNRQVETDEPARERERSEEDHERSEADVRPHEDHDCERDRQDTAQAEHPAGLLDSIAGGLFGLLKDGAHLMTSVVD